MKIVAIACSPHAFYDELVFVNALSLISIKRESAGGSAAGLHLWRMENNLFNSAVKRPQASDQD
jgi:hypothetical protein